MDRATTRTSMRIPAPRDVVYRACLDPASWRVPDGMTALVHENDVRVGGLLRMSLRYDDPLRAGKSEDNVDTFTGRYAELTPGERIVEIVSFDSDDPAFAGEMRLTTTLVDDGPATIVTVECAGLPAGVDPADNELGTQQALARLAALLRPSSPFNV